MNEQINKLKQWQRNIECHQAYKQSEFHRGSNLTRDFCYCMFEPKIYYDFGLNFPNLMNIIEIDRRKKYMEVKNVEVKVNINKIHCNCVR